MFAVARACSRVAIAPRRFASSSANVLRFTKFGAPLKQLSLQKEPLPSLGPKDVHVRMLAAPVNPADLNMIQGTYGVVPKLPAVAGIEGAAIVEAVGKDVFQALPGDIVVPIAPNFGTWRTEGVLSADQFLVASKTAPLEFIAIAYSAGVSAMALLNSFASLKPGDVVVQNGANSTVGQAVIQLANRMGLKTINIVRQRPDWEVVAPTLKAYGASIVVPDSFAATGEYRAIASDFPAAKLALNMAGGPSVQSMARLLAPGATLVTYGGMSRTPVQISPGQLIFKELNLRGFWLQRWQETHAAQAQTYMNEICTLLSAQSLKFLVERHRFTDWQRAVERAEQPFRTRKVVMTFYE